MQNRDGGWGAFDRDCDKARPDLRMPFADHNAMIDPSTADLTARGLEASRARATARATTSRSRAIEFLLGEQEPDGSWYGRWGCNYIYGTWLAASVPARCDRRGPVAQPWGSAVPRRGCSAARTKTAVGASSPHSYEDPTLQGASGRAPPRRLPGRCSASAGARRGRVRRWTIGRGRPRSGGLLSAEQQGDGRCRGDDEYVDRHRLPDASSTCATTSTTIDYFPLQALATYRITRLRSESA